MNPRRSDRGVNPDVPPEASADAPLFGVVGPDGPAAESGPAPPTPPHAAPDPFDPKRLRLRMDDGASLGLLKRLSTVPVRKPSKEAFVRTHPDSDSYWLNTHVIELKDDREVYLVAPDLWPELAGESTFSARSLVLAVTRDGAPFVWPVRLPGPDGKLDNWSETAREAAILGRTAWVRVTANMAAGGYDVHEATGIVAEPKWPAEGMGDILKAAFRGKMIEERDHPVLCRLRGER